MPVLLKDSIVFVAADKILLVSGVVLSVFWLVLSVHGLIFKDYSP